MRGFLEVELTSAEPESALAAINQENIMIQQLLRIDDLSCSFRISSASYGKLTYLLKKRGDSLKVNRKVGQVWLLSDIARRSVLLTGIVLLLATCLFLPTRVLFVKVDGVEAIPKQMILDAAEQCGICFGASRKAVRSEKMKNALLSKLPQLQWAGVNTKGCVAYISVREKAETEAKKKKGAVSSIAAGQDGLILSGTVTRGQGLFSVGQTVTEGEILISGYTDCGLCIKAEKAEGEIFAQTARDMTIVSPSEALFVTDLTDCVQRYSLIIKKKRINLWKDSGIFPSGCGRMYKEYYLTLPGGFRLPIAFCVEDLEYRNMQAQEIPESVLRNAAAAYAEQYLLRHMTAGHIMKREAFSDARDGVHLFKGRYVCSEMIGREVAEQIGDIHGKNS